MIEVRIHGRGGQGAVLASLVMAHAAQRRGYHVQVFPEFGVERRNVPVTAFARLDTKPIRLRTKVTKPDQVIVLDPDLARYLPVTDGLKADGLVLMNAQDGSAGERLGNGWRFAWVDATSIAAKHKIGTTTAPIVNTTMVGAFAAASRIFGTEDVEAAIAAVIPQDAAKNVAAALEAFRDVQLKPSGVTQDLQRLYEQGSGR